MLDGLLVHMKDKANSTARTGNCEAGTRHFISLQLITSPEIWTSVVYIRRKEVHLKKNKHVFYIDKAFKIMITHIPGIQTRKLNIFQRMLVFNKFNHLYFTLFKITFKVKIDYHDNHWQQPWSSWWCPQEISLYFWKHLPESSGQGTVQHYPFSLFSPLSKKFYNKYWCTLF